LEFDAAPLGEQAHDELFTDRIERPIADCLRASANLPGRLFDSINLKPKVFPPGLVGSSPSKASDLKRPGFWQAIVVHAQRFSAPVSEALPIIGINGAVALRPRIDMKLQWTIGEIIGVLDDGLHREN
jgi:hypothetical protein